MKFLNSIQYFLIIVTILLAACTKDDFEEPEQEDTKTELSAEEKHNILVNNWINNTMDLYYLWEKELPRPLTQQQGDPEEYYYSLLNPRDKWSFMTDDFEEYFADFQGTPTSMGYSPAFYLYNNSENVLIVVKYVYPGSPAEEAGLQRGDLILTINGNYLTPDNYYNLYSGSSYSVGLASLENNTLNLTGENIAITARVIETNPVLYHSTYQSNGKKIGYLAYATFVAGQNDIFLNKLDAVLNNFKSEGIDELVIDLRYNNGGDLNAAIHFASALVPKAGFNSDDIFLKRTYNQLLTNHYIQQQGSNSPQLFVNFRQSRIDLNLNDIYFLVTSGSASASEALIAGLMPYINTTLIGESTAGKYTGMFVIGDTEEPARHNYGVFPVTFKYENSSGYTDFDNGIPVDHEINDDLINAVPLGDPSDPMLAKAFELITGDVILAAKSKPITHNFEMFTPKKFDIMNNLWEIKNNDF